MEPSGLRRTCLKTQPFRRTCPFLQKRTTFRRSRLQTSDPPPSRKKTQEQRSASTPARLPALPVRQELSRLKKNIRSGERIRENRREILPPRAGPGHALHAAFSRRSSFLPRQRRSGRDSGFSEVLFGLFPACTPVRRSPRRRILRKDLPRRRVPGSKAQGVSHRII